MNLRAGRVILLLILGVYMEVAMDANAMPGTSADVLAPIDVRNVKVEGEIGRRIGLTIEKNLLALDIDKDFLLPFEEKRSESDWAYIALGKLIDSTVRFAAYSNDERVIALKNHLIDTAIAFQEPDGYIGIFVPGKRLATLWDIHEMSYLILGMLSDYQYFGNEKSLQSAIKMTDYMIENWQVAHPWTQAKVGLDYSLLQMYKETGDEKYLRFCLDERKLAEWDKPIKVIVPSTGDEDGDGIDGHHAYAYMDECRSQLDLYRIQPAENLLTNSRNVLDFLTRENGLFVAGSCSHAETWTIDQNTRGQCQESCTTAYLLRFLENRLRLEGDSLPGDIMERAIFNALFAAQAADGRKIRYFTAIEGSREYFSMDTSCCPGNFRRIMAELPSMIYYQSGPGIAINLYTQSSADITLGNDNDNGVKVNISQMTDYPNSGNVLIKVNPSESAEFPLSLRIPRWCDTAGISVNGKPTAETVSPGSFFIINRKWNPGDQVELKMPMEFRLVKGRALNTMKVAVMRGPVLFCLNPSLNEPYMAIGEDGLIGLNLDTWNGPVTDATVRPDGMAAKVMMWAKNKEGQVASVELHLTEFPDPDGQVTYLPMQGLYFKGNHYGDANVKNIDMMTDDELFFQ